MASRESPILSNASRFPRDLARAIQARPTMLCDETTEVVRQVARTLVRSGHRAELAAVCEESGLDTARRAVLRAACFNHGKLH